MMDWIMRKSTDIVRACLLAFLIIAPTVTVFAKQGAAGAGVLAAVGAAALLLTRLPDVSSFELLTLKVRLERQSQQVEVTLQQLQKMAVAFAQANTTEMAMSGQMLFGLNTAEKFHIHDNIINSLKTIGIPHDEIMNAQVVWIGVYCRMIFDSIERIASSSDSKAEAEIENLPKVDKWALPTPDTLRNWIATKSLHDAKLTELMDEYDHIWTTGTMKNPDLIPFNQIMRSREPQKP